MHHAVGAVDRPGDVGRIGDRAEHVGRAVDARGSPLQGAHLVAGGDELGRHGAAEEARTLR